MANTDFQLDFSARYKVESWNLAVAVYPVEYKEESHEEWEFCGTDEDDSDDDSLWDLNVWWEADKDWVYVTMVGDDTKHLVEVSDLVKLDDDDYCSGCGQIGCHWC